MIKTQCLLTQKKLKSKESIHLNLPSSFRRSNMTFTMVTKPSFTYHHFLRCSNLLVLLFIYLFGPLKANNNPWVASKLVMRATTRIKRDRERRLKLTGQLVVVSTLPPSPFWTAFNLHLEIHMVPGSWLHPKLQQGSVWPQLNQSMHSTLQIGDCFRTR